MPIALSDYIHKLPGMALFRGIEERDLSPMMGCLGAFLRSYEKNETIYLSDDDILHVGVVMSGAVQMIREDIWGNKALLVNMGEGDLFGETFACSGIHNRLVSFIAAEDSVILFAPFKRVISSCAQSCGFHRQLTENLIIAIAEKNITLMEKVDIISKRSLREKIIEYLSLQAKNSESMAFTVPLGRVQLAEFLHADRSALTRELNLMADEGLIEFQRNNFRILKKLV